MAIYLFGLALFFGVHLFSAFRSRVPEKDMKLKMGFGPFMGLYSLLSLAGFILLIVGYRQAPAGDLIYAGFSSARTINHVLMAVAFVLLIASYVPNNHFKLWVKHPMVVGVGLWAFAHLITGVNTKEAILFGSFFVYCIIDFVAALPRPSPVPDGPQTGPTLISLGVGLAAYAGFFLWGHAAIFGVSPA